MRERTARRGPKFPLPVETSDSTYYSIDTTEDIYGTTLLPSQRCYVDPWDLENYDYVRKSVKIDPTPQSTSFYDSSKSPSPAGEPVATQYFYMQKSGDFECADCYSKADEEALFNTVKYDDYPGGDPRMYNTYGDFGSSSPSSERNSSCGEESVATLRRNTTAGFGATPRRRGMSLPKPEPMVDYPSAPYDYCSPYGETPYASVCSVPDCYECLSQNHNALLYSSPPSIYESSFYGSTLSRRSESLYGNTYGNKFGLSKKGLLQIDYSCSWNDLDRVIGRNF
ncbi:uncharacterized protein LOC129940561 isoform X1 [Eupeodes corollae]|uniref:uncharacterized protein LOC129940561 isoform X1 n=1 Tax=Eupeodes corollae TaxID=290404 RepID=UPI0024937523|nr:uncharacterized protein LOC129940561 isoform X1 [Eupeodes corollae]